MGHLSLFLRGKSTKAHRIGIGKQSNVEYVGIRLLIRCTNTSQKRPPDVRIRTLFVDSLTGPVLQMLGSRYNIEPFFFSSAIGWIPSRFQTHLIPNVSDRE